MQRELPRLLIFGAAVTCGILIALAAHILSGSMGLDLSSVGDLAGGGGRLKSALAWWLIAGSAFVGSFVAAVILKNSSSSSPVPRVLRWAIVAVFVIALAAVGRAASAQVGVPGLSQLITSLAALGLGTVMALCGTYFAMRQ